MKRAVLLALLVTGCQTTEDRIAADDRQCQSYGVAKGSPEYVMCRANLDAGRANVQASREIGRGSSLTGTIERMNSK